MTTPPTLTLPIDLLKASSQPRQILLQHLRLLHLIYHRSKNQHRRSQWFRHFNTFRREVSRLCGDLGIDASRGLGEDAGEPMRDAGKKLTQKLSLTPRDKVLSLHKQQDRAIARRKALLRLQYWIDAGLIVKWYTSITTITATPSFTPLALTLLALLARIYSITGIISYITAVTEQEQQEQQAEEEEEMHRALARFAEVDAQSLWANATNQRSQVDSSAGDDDYGIVLAREDITKQISSTSKQSVTATPTPATMSARYESKIRSSPLIQPSDELALMKQGQAASTMSNKKRKLDVIEKDKKRLGVKKLRKPKNEIDALFAGLG